LAPATARVALNAGQFTDDGPWGWVVHDGRELRTPGDGPLAMAVIVDTLGAVHLVEADRLAETRANGGIVEAFQSYPALLVRDGEIPLPIRERGRGVELDHRDSRLAIGELRDGRILLALTRFDALGGKLSELPFGPTLPEMAAIMGALGCARAVALDGGISAQLLVRESGGEERAWRGLRAVPLGLVVLPRTAK
jgi:exopolysaccharide biosynthesis protein